ncbi:MAG: ArnT family glycosyltransferase [Bacillota bacterium]
MSCVTSSPLPDVNALRAWKLDWLTPIRCRMILVAVLAFGFFGHLRYLNHNCPIALSGDEAHYWDWSRQLDWSYYSKGPLVAYIIRASCALFGDTMAAVRYPALVLALGVSLATYWLARKLFESDRVALGAVLLYHLVPMFMAGSVLMTIDPPFFFCWGLATCFAAKAIFDGRRWAWVALGLAVGVGFLAKYAMFLWLVSLLVFLIIDRDARKYLRSRWPWMATGIALLFTTPVIVWNARNGWVSLWHVTRQTGTGSEASFEIGNPLEFIGGQIGALGPMLVVILVGAAVYALSRRGSVDPHRRGMRFLACIGLTYFGIVGITSLRTKIQVNWPAPAYFTLMILAAYFLGTRLQNRSLWKPWRVWLWGTVATGFAFMPLAHNTELIYPLVGRISRMVSKKEPTAKWDFSYKLRGWEQLGQRVSKELATLNPGAFVLCANYQVTAEMAFYVKGQPKTYYVGSWYQNPEERTRQSQYDLWPDRRLDNAALFGRDAVFIGYTPPADLRAAFESMESIPDETIVRSGLMVRTFQMWRCKSFKGMRRPVGEGTF